MSLRSFTIFQDTPDIDAPQQAKRAIRTSPILTRSGSLTLGQSLSTENVLDAAAIIDKENYHPVTGERAGSKTEKKRKTNVLATKLHSSTVSSTKRSKVAEPLAKKRKTSTSTKGKVTPKKEERLSTGQKLRSKRSASRQVSPMPKVDEEGETEKGGERLTQAAIDSRCYELTVKPLADVSQAYEEGSCADGFICNDKSLFRTVKESSAEPELRDYFSPPPSLSSSHLEHLAEDTEETRTFSTPERKQIYSAFTFCSPSPTGKRFKEASRSRTASPSSHTS